MFRILSIVLLVVVLVVVFRLIRSQGKKTIKIIVGSLGGLYAIAQLVTLLVMLQKGAHSAYQWGRLTGAIIAIVIGAVISFACFKSAFTKKENTRAY